MPVAGRDTTTLLKYHCIKFSDLNYLKIEYYCVPYTCRCAAMTVVPEGCELDDAAAEREDGTTERPPPDAEPLELGLGGAVLNQHNII